MLKLLTGLLLIDLARTTAHTHANLVVERAGGHSGSQWLATLIASQGVATFFQFGGMCSAVDKRGVMHDTSTKLTRDTEAKMRLVFNRGCDCAYHVYDEKNDTYKQLDSFAANPLFRCTANVRGSCEQLPFCKKEQCKTTAENLAKCRAVAIVGAPIATHSVAALGSKTAFMTWQRDNSVKHALSVIKARLREHTLFPNHGLATDAPPPRAMFWVQPEELLLEAKNKVESRQDLRTRVQNLEMRVAYAAHYEEFQINTNTELRALLGTVGVEAALAVESPIVKSVSEDLSQLLVNFAEVNSTFAKWPCLHRQLLSKKPERFEICSPAEIHITHGTPTRQFERHVDRIYQINCKGEVCVPADCGGRGGKFDSKLGAICDRARKLASGDNFVLLVQD